MARLSRVLDFVAFNLRSRFGKIEIADEPMLDPEASEWLASRLARANSYLEFGAGGTTRLAARVQVPTISVESDRHFAQAVRDGLAPGHKVKLIDAGIGLTTEWGIPFPGSPTPGRVKKWRRYIVRPFELLARTGMAFPQLVLVDGRFRRACALKTAMVASEKGESCDLLFDDYFGEDRAHYHVIEEQLGSPKRIGRAALFSIGPNSSVEAGAIEGALQDYR